jgi:hypothetical protein
MTSTYASIVDNIFGVSDTRLATYQNMENCDLES